MSHAPGESGVFGAEQAETLIESDTDHWWFQSKAAIVSDVMARHLGDHRTPGWLADIGAGGGGVTAMLQWPHDHRVAVEGNAALADRARKEHGLAAIRAHGDRLPLQDGSVTVVTLLDVIEHLPAPLATLVEATRILEPGGMVIVTVPGHSWLWSGADELLGHVKRYTIPVLRQELTQAGFEVRFCSHIFSWLVPAMWLHRRLARSANAQLGLGTTSPTLSRIARTLTRLELGVSRRVSLPLGSSVVALGYRAPGPDRTPADSAETRDHLLHEAASGPEARLPPRDSQPPQRPS